MPAISLSGRWRLRDPAFTTDPAHFGHATTFTSSSVRIVALRCGECRQLVYLGNANETYQILRARLPTGIVRNDWRCLAVRRLAQRPMTYRTPA
jgi:hypothetical protein